MRNTIVTT